MAARPALGRGVAALLAEMGSPAAAAGAAPPTTLPLAQVHANPRQPRRRFDPAALEELTASVKARGVLQPILVRPVAPARYEIVAGERRWRAAQAAGLHDIPALVRELDEAVAFEIALVENIQRADLDPIEEVEGYQRLMREYGHTQDALAKLTGKSRSHIANLLRLLELPEAIRDMVASGVLSPGHAKALIGLSDPLAAAHRVVADGLSVRATEALRKPGSTPKMKRQATTDPDLAALERQIAEATGVQTTISGGDAGTLTLRYGSLDQLDGLVARLMGGRF